MTQPYSDDVKVRAVALLESNGGNVSEVARALGIKRETIIRWRDAIKPHLAPQRTSPDILADRVSEEIQRIGFGNLSDVVEWDERGIVRFIPSREFTPAQAAIVSELRVKRRRDIALGDKEGGWEIEDMAIKTRDKLGALKSLAEIVGLIKRGGDKADAGGTTINNYGNLSLAEIDARIQQLGTG